jgi:hypothetical protein
VYFDRPRNSGPAAALGETGGPALTTGAVVGLVEDAIASGKPEANDWTLLERLIAARRPAREQIIESKAAPVFAAHSNCAAADELARAFGLTLGDIFASAGIALEAALGKKLPQPSSPTIASGVEKLASWLAAKPV